MSRAVRNGAVRVGVLFTSLGLLAGCPQTVAAVAPTLDCGVAVVEDAVAGLSVPEIVAKEGARCGADAEAVIAALLASRDTRLVGTPALRSARLSRGLRADP